MKVVWTLECDEVLQNLKEKLMNPPFIVFCDPSKDYIIYTDASHQMMSAGLGQEYKEGEHESGCVLEPESRTL